MTTATGPGLFSEEHYRQIIATYGYSPFDMRRFDFPLADLEPAELTARYLCHHRADQYARTPARRRAVTTGFGMSGPPHMATASHLQKMIRLQTAGEHCQIVLGDLDAYNGRNQTLAKAADLADRFAVFAERLGFDSQAGTLRRQSDYTPALHALYLLGRYTNDADFDQCEEDTHDYYAQRGLVDATMTFRRRLSLSLMAADFITLGQDFDAILVVLGVDEHKYVRFAADVATRFDTDTSLRGSFTLASAYTRMNTGFNGHPKFAKSIPGSSIHVQTPDDQIRDLVCSDTERDPHASPVFQLMCQMSYCTPEQLAAIDHDCRTGARAWDTERDRFAEYLVSIKELWPQ